MIMMLVAKENSWADEKSAKSSSLLLNSYRSTTDTLLTLKTVAIAPAYDNVGGIYKKAAEQKISQLIKEDHFWSFEEINFSGGGK